jgi:hypothetical protein
MEERINIADYRLPPIGIESVPVITLDIYIHVIHEALRGSPCHLSVLAGVCGTRKYTIQ